MIFITLQCLLCACEIFSTILLYYVVAKNYVLTFLWNHSLRKYLLNIPTIKYVNHNNNHANHKWYDSRLDMQFEQHGICNICSIRPCYHGGTCGRDLNNASFAKPGNVYVFHYIKLSPHNIRNNDRAYPWIFFIIKVLLKQISLRLFQFLRQNHCILITISLIIL